MLLCRTKSKPGGLIGLDFRAVTYGWFIKVGTIWKKKKSSMYQVTAIHIMEEFYIWPIASYKRQYGSSYLTLLRAAYIIIMPRLHAFLAFSSNKLLWDLKYRKTVMLWFRILIICSLICPIRYRYHLQLYCKAVV